MVYIVLKKRMLTAHSLITHSFMNKKAICLAISEQLQAELKQTIEAANNAHKAATDDQSKAETQYDTLAIEASYLAAGQSQRVHELQQALQTLAQLELRVFSADEPIALGALVQLQRGDIDRHWLFIAPVAGGYRCRLTQREIAAEVTLVTPQSPMGKALLAKYLDDEICVEIAGKTRSETIIALI